ncbi:hypothetical protein [Streptomyces sp. WM6386]|nr:hypothetical protein [Streptomyces sp. WM6386]
MLVGDCSGEKRTTDSGNLVRLSDNGTATAAWFKGLARSTP